MNIITDILPSPSDTNCIWYEANSVLSAACILNKVIDDKSQYVWQLMGLSMNHSKIYQKLTALFP